MKKLPIIGFVIVVACLTQAGSSFAQTTTITPHVTSKITPTTATTGSAARRTTPTPASKSTPTATEEAELNRIQKIKDMVASRVAQLKLVEKRGILGKVVEVESTQITVKDNKGEQRVIDIDELTKFQSNKSSNSKNDDDESFGISDIKEGDEVAFVGQYNKQTDRLLARVVLLPKSIPEYLEGVVTSTDEDAYSFEVSTGDAKTVVDYEKATTAQMVTKDEGAEKSGFSQIEEGQRVLVVGFKDDDNGHIIATRITHFVDLPPTTDMKKGVDLEVKEEATPSAKSSPTLTPRTQTKTSPTKTLTPAR